MAGVSKTLKHKGLFAALLLLLCLGQWAQSEHLHLHAGDINADCYAFHLSGGKSAPPVSNLRFEPPPARQLHTAALESVVVPAAPRVLREARAPPRFS